jgi:hypothetical protein
MGMGVFMPELAPCLEGNPKAKPDQSNASECFQPLAKACGYGGAGCPEQHRDQ